MSKYLSLGQIVKPQGIKGEVKLVSYVERISGFKTLTHVYLDGQRKEIVRARADGSGVFLLFKDVNDRDTAEKLRNKEIKIPLEEAEPFRVGYFVIELEGLKIITNDTELGILSEVLHTGSVDVFVVKGKKNFMVPYLKKLVLSVDLDKNIMLFDSKVFEEVVTYED